MYWFLVGFTTLTTQTGELHWLSRDSRKELPLRLPPKDFSKKLSHS